MPQSLPLLLGLLCLTTACHSIDPPTPPTLTSLSLLEMEYLSGEKDSLVFSYDHLHRLYRVIHGSYEGTELARCFEYDAQDQLQTQVYTSIFFGTATFVVTEQYFRYETQAHGQVEREWLERERRTTRFYGENKDAYVMDTTFTPALLSISIQYDSAGNLSRYHWHQGRYAFAQEAQFEFDSSHQLTHASYLKPDPSQPQVLQITQVYDSLGFDRQSNPLYEMSRQLGMPVPDLLMFQTGLKLPHVIQPHNPIRLVSANQIAPFAAAIQSFEHTYNPDGLPMLTRASFLDHSRPISYRYEY